MSKPGSTYKGGAFSGPGAVHQGSRVRSLRRIDQIPWVRVERRAMPLLTSTTVGQRSDKSAERGMGRRGSRPAWTTGERETRSHSADLTLEQERVIRAQYDTRDTYGWRTCKQYECYDAQIVYAWMHVLYILSLLPTYMATVLRFLAHRSLPVTSRYYRTMLKSVYL